MQKRALFLSLILLALATGGYAAPGPPDPPGQAHSDAGAGPPNGNGPGGGPGPNAGTPPGQSNQANAPAPKADPGPKGTPPGTEDSGKGPKKPDTGNRPGGVPPDGPDSTVLSPEGSITIGADQNVARDAVARGAALPLGRIAKSLEQDFGLRVIDAKLLQSKAGLIYRLTVISRTGLTQRVLVDAKSGRLLRTD
jgi:hypothetical protein